MKKVTRFLLKIAIILVWTIIFFLQFEHPRFSRILQNISPSLLISILPPLFYSLMFISVPLIILAFKKGRFFCWNICPLGLAQDILPSLGKSKPHKVNLYIFLFLLIVSLSGLNMPAIFDPIVIFNRTAISPGLKKIEFAIFASFSIIILLLNLFKKRFWCHNLCPLGAAIDWLGTLRTKNKIDLNKRKTLIAAGSGLIFWFLFKKQNAFGVVPDNRLLRPPGALPEDEFADRCIRCGSCVSVCLTKTLTPSIMDTGLRGIFTPKLIPQLAECDEHCNKCGQSCPTSAIKNMPLKVKRNFKIGTVKIDRSTCLSWKEDKSCLICKEFCPYLAISIIPNNNGLPSPQEIPDLCRGCGLCENKCPVRPVRSIKVFNTNAGKIINI